MILGKIFGKITTSNFQFLVEKETRKFEFIQVLHKVYDYVLCQVVEIERTDKDIAKCIVIGYKDDKGRIKPIRIPFEQNCEVLKAEDDFIKEVIKLDDSESGAFIGRLEGKNIDVHLDLKKLLTKHIAILAKSGAGKSYAVGVLIEEIIDKKVPILIIDPHGEYSSLKLPNDADKKALMEYNLKPMSFKNIYEYGDTKLNPGVRPLRLNNNLNATEITHLIPGKLSNTQLGLLYSALKHIDRVNFTNVLLEMEKEENNSKWTIINNLEHLNNLQIFTDSPVPYNEFIQPGRCSIINLKGISPDIQEIIVYKLMKDLFEMRKKNKIPPFFTVIEEAHNYCVTGDTTIDTPNGKKKIKNLKLNDLILTYNHKINKLEENSIIKKWPKRKAQLIELFSESGQILKCTPDHPIYSENKYIQSQFANNFSIPLWEPYSMNKKIIDARLIGALFSDGWICVNKQVGFSGLYQDMITIQDDLKKLEISSSKISTIKNQSKIQKVDGSINIINGSGSSFSCSIKAYNYFTSIGAIIGEKVTKKSIIPKWILKGNKSIKSEFLAGLMGGDGDKPKPAKLNFYAIRFYFYKVDNLKNNAKEYAKRIIGLFNEFDVKSSLSIKKGNIRKRDGKTTSKYIVSINNKDSNLINFFEKIGYRYNRGKELITKQALYYLKTKKQIISANESLRKKALKLRKEKGWGKVRIARELNLYPSKVAKWIYKSYNTNNSRLGKNIFPSFNSWKKNNVDSLFIHDKIFKKNILKENYVYNLSTKNKNYIANGILVHNCPERSFGETRSSKILRTVASEGRKFGLGLCVVSQRPARVDKSVLSQCTTQIILKVTNPNDLKAISNSVEGITSESAEEIRNLSIGTALITGIVDMPLFVNIRTRMTAHGGESTDILDQSQDQTFFEQVEEFDEADILPIIKPNTSLKDIKLMSEKEIKKVDEILIPGFLFLCVDKDSEYNLLVESVHGEVIIDIELFTKKAFPKLDKLKPSEIKVLHVAFQMKKFKEEDLVKKGLPLDISSELNVLTHEKYLTKTNDIYTLSDKYILSQLSKYACFSKIEFQKINYHVKKDAKLDVDTIKEKLSKFTTIKDQRECFILVHEIQYIDG